MARLRAIDDPNDLGQGYPQEFPGQGGDQVGAALFPMPEMPPGSTPPKAQEQGPQSSDRQAFQKDWMGSSGTMDEFMASHPQYKDYVKPHQGSKDVYDIGGDESLDLVGDVGGKNAHNWTGTGMNAQGVPDQPGNQGGFGPQGNLPPAFGSLSDFMASQGSGAASKSSPQDLMSVIQGLFPGGMYNQGVVNQRVDNSRDTLHRQLKSRTATNQALLADRGLLGSGPEQTAQNRAEEDLYGQFTNAVGGINADESAAADQRMMSALQLAAGMTAEQARNAIESFKAQSADRLGQGSLALGNKNSDIDQMLGLGNLALGNTKASNDYNLGKGTLDLGWGQLDSSDWNTLQQLLLQGANISSQGRVK